MASLPLQPPKWPYLQVLFNTRLVIESLLYFQPQRGVLFLIVMFSIADAFIPSARGTSPFGNDFVMPLIKAPFALVTTLVWTYGWSYLMYYCALLLGLSAKPREIRLVLTWSWVPITPVILLSAVGYFVLTMGSLVKDEWLAEFLVVGFLGAIVVAGIWSAKILFVGLRVLAGSWSKALGLLLIPSLLMLSLVVVGQALFYIFE